MIVGDLELLQALRDRFFRISPMSTSACARCRARPRSIDPAGREVARVDVEHHLGGDDRHAVPTADAALIMAPTSVSTIALKLALSLPNSERAERGTARLADAVRVRCPAWPMAIMKYQRDVVSASTIRFLTILHAVAARATKPKVTCAPRWSRSLMIASHAYHAGCARPTSVELHRGANAVAADGDELRDVPGAAAR